MNLFKFSKDSPEYRMLRVETRTIIDAAIKAAIAIAFCPYDGEVKAGEGYRSIITVADAESQRIIFSHLTEAFPDARILGEEKTRHRAAISPKNPAGILGKGLYFIVDPVDGTTPFSHRQGDWCIGISTIRDGIFICGVIFAPDINGGLLVFAEKGTGTFFQEGTGAVIRIDLHKGQSDPKRSIAKFGVDARLYPDLQNMESEIAHNFQGLYIAGSGLLALANVALGRVGLVVQPPQKPWDWAQAVPLICEAGKTIWFYRLVDGRVVHVEEPDERAFTLPRDTNGLGFIAGESTLVERAIRIFPKTGWHAIDPDTVSGTW